MEKIPADAEDGVLAYYSDLDIRLAEIRERLRRPLSLAEKILFAHWVDRGRLPVPGSSTEGFRPDRVAMQDATAQMALLQFMSAGRAEVAVPTTVHCDHLIRARVGAREDLAIAESSNEEVYAFLASVSARHGIGFWQPGSGIIHQVVLEHYAFPGGLMIGTDSHTPNAGGLGMLAVGVGGADAVDVLVGMPWELQWPKRIGVRLVGQTSGWTSGKDVILKLAGLLTASGGTGHVIEYFGPGTATLSATAKATITNMGAELGATTSVFPFDERMAAYLEKTGRARLAARARALAAQLTADPEVIARPDDYFDRVVTIDLATLEPHVVGPHTPDLARPVSALADDVRAHNYPETLQAALIGSCTNSSYEDIGRAAHVARQARALGLKAKVPFLVTPGSEQVRATIERDGLLADLTAIGATVLANACGPCIGQWQRDDVAAGTPNSILTSYNRNFPRRNDGNPGTHAFIASPEIVTAYALTGSLGDNPLAGVMVDGERVVLSPPVADELPRAGFVAETGGYTAPREDGSAVVVRIREDSERLSLLAPFPAPKPTDFEGLAILLKAVGKCTTDHISAAGPWLKYRGHLDKISDNLFMGAVNAFADAPGTGFDVLTQAPDVPLARLARAYKARGIGWVAVGDRNYGEGSSREHAAMSPRYLGGRVILVRSFARIHETNLKKQGVLPLTFADPGDYDRLMRDDRISLPGIRELAPGMPVAIVVTGANGKTWEMEARHTLTAEQVSWFWAGSALNLMGARSRAPG
ncbi:aconitate hydratase [Acidiferrobacter sp.]|uniref:aconitate hydratase n=1 Tax=Acidiferrobacter sp. TaxID=1872107 RepID=UPI002623FC65|nr:aconitate hydratase [Acidiferrobacter sp.]